MTESTRTELKDYGSSVVRTVTLPAVVTAILLLVKQLTGIDLAGWEFILIPVASYAAYAVVRFLEVFASPKWGYVLGLPKKVAYTPAAV